MIENILLLQGRQKIKLSHKSGFLCVGEEKAGIYWKDNEVKSTDLRLSLLFSGLF